MTIDPKQELSLQDGVEVTYEVLFGLLVAEVKDMLRATLSSSAFLEHYQVIIYAHDALQNHQQVRYFPGVGLQVDKGPARWSLVRG